MEGREVMCMRETRRDCWDFERQSCASKREEEFQNSFPFSRLPTGTRY